MALRLLRLLQASAAARGLAAGAQRVVSGGRHVLPGSRTVLSEPRFPGVVGQTLQPQAPEIPTHSSGFSFAAGLSLQAASGEPGCRGAGVWARLLVRSVFGKAALLSAPWTLG